MKFSDRVWQKIVPIYEKILQHPFNVELAEGSLDEERFVFYMEQDAHYLVSFSRALALIAGRANDSQMISHFLYYALGALVAERELHKNFLPPNYDSDKTEPSPACLGYTQTLIAKAATAPLEEAVAAVLPCFWIYREVGRHISAQARKTNPYIRWIDTYSSPEFSDATDQAISILDALASRCNPEVLDRMEQVFEYSALYEWHFWDDAYAMSNFKDMVPEADLMPF